jgi:hypothetical protein
MANIPSDFLAAAMTADARQLTAALRVLRGEKAVSGPIFITGSASARLLGIGRTTFRRWAAMAGIKPVEVFPKCFRYRREEVEAIARKSEVAS